MRQILLRSDGNLALSTGNVLLSPSVDLPDLIAFYSSAPARRTNVGARAHQQGFADQEIRVVSQ